MFQKMLKSSSFILSLALIFYGVVIGPDSYAWGSVNSATELIEQLKKFGHVHDGENLDVYPVISLPGDINPVNPIENLFGQFSFSLPDLDQLPQGIDAEYLIGKIFTERINPVNSQEQSKVYAFSKDGAIYTSGSTVNNTSTLKMKLFSGCTPKATPKGDVIVCSGTDFFGVDGGRGDDEITVEPGASVSTLAMDPPFNSQPQTTAIDGEEDDDTITNEGTVAATAISAGNILKLSPSNGSDDDSSDNNDLEEKKGALAIGIEGNDGSDNIINTGAITATAVTTATDIPIDSSVVKVDIGASEAIAEAIGMDGGSEDDFLGNAGTVTATATAISLKAEISSNKGLSTSDDAATAIATTTGMIGGEGNDAIINEGEITAVSTSVVGVGNGTGGSSSALTTRFSAAGTHRAEAVSIGLTTDEGDDTITNTGNITAVSTAATNAIIVDIPANGAASGDSTSEAITDATAVIAGDGNDSLTNSGDLTAVAISEATAQSASVAKSGNSKLSPSTSESSTTAESTAMGVDTGAGIDDITNYGTITSVATSATYSGVVGIVTEGQSTTDSSSKAKAVTTGIDMGNESDALENYGDITAVSTATAASIEFAFSDKNDADASKKALSEGGAVAEAIAHGISGDGTEGTTESDKDLKVLPHEITAAASYAKLAAQGDDTINNYNAVTAVATAISGAGTQGASIQGAASASAISKATAKAMAVDAGMGHDTVFNDGAITAVATAAANSLALSFSESKTATVKAGATSDAEATGLSADGMPSSYFIGTELVISLVDGLYEHSYIEKIGASGNDNLINNGAVTAVATAESGSSGIGISVKGVSSAKATTKATATAMGIDAGMGDDILDSNGDITAVSTAAANSIAFSFSDAENEKAKGEAKAGATSDATATGLSADGMPASIIAETELSINLLDGLNTRSRLAKIAATGNDTITNTGAITSVATAESGSAALSVSIKNANAASANATATASALGIDLGGGNDSLESTGPITAVATSVAGAVEFSYSNEKDAGTVTTSFLKKAFTSNGSLAEADAIGIRSDGTVSSYLAETSLHIWLDGIEEKFHFEKAGSTGSDEIINSSNVTAVATAASGQISGSVSADYVWIEGSAKSDATSVARAKALGIEAGDGNDMVGNSGEVTAVSTATALALAATFSKGGSSSTSPKWLDKKIFDYGAIAESEAVGIKGDGDFASHYVDQFFSISAGGFQTGASYEYAASSGNDFITNGPEGSVVAVSTAVSGSASVSASAEGTASVDSSSSASSMASAINAGAGDDTVTNSADLAAVSTATAGALGVSLTQSKGGNANAGASAESEAIGISGDGNLGSGIIEAILDVDLEGLSAKAGFEIISATGDDIITNDGSVTAVSTAVSGAESVAISLEGGASTNMSSTAKSAATAIDAGSGNDTITNNGTLTAVSTATAASFSAALAGKGGDTWNDFKSLFTGGTKAEATAKGLTGDSTGQDFSSWSTLKVSFSDLDVRLASEISLVQAGGVDDITNTGLITATAVATAPSVDAAISLDGKATAVSTAEATAEAVAIDAGTDSDTVYNTGELVATAVATAEAVNIALSKSVAFAADGIWQGSTAATARATGISGDGEGRDWQASGEIEVTDEAVRLSTDLSTTVVSGDDEITNEGPVVATAVSAVPSLGVAVSVDSAGAAVSTAEAEAQAVGIDGGAGNDIVDNSGEVVATSVATAAVMNVAVTKGASLSGNSLWNGGTEARSEAVGISGDGKGRDWTATGTIEVTEEAVYLGTELETTMVSGVDNITSTGPVVATSVATAPTAAITVSVDSAGAALATASAESRAVGIDAGSGGDTVVSEDEVVATSVATAAAMNIAVTKSASMVGSSLWDGATTAESEAIGISGDGEGRDLAASGEILVADGDVWLSTELNSFIAGGHDTINSYGTIVATSVATVPSLGVSVSVNGVAGAVAKAEAESRAAGIDAGTGNDTVLSNGELVATSIATAADLNIAVSKSFSLAGGGLWDGATTATSEAVGISGDGKGQDYMAAGNLSVVDGDVHLDALLSSTRVSGEDYITSNGTIVATSIAAAPSAAVAVSVNGGSAAMSTAEADARAVGIDAGAGNDTVLSTDAIVATADATAATGNVSIAKGFAVASGGLWDGGAKANAEAVGISGDGEGRDFLAEGSIDVSDDDVLLETYLSFTEVSGDDVLDNEGTIVATSVAVAPTLDVAVAIQGFAMAASKATAESRAAGIDGGSGNDETSSSGTIVATSVANADAVSVAVTPSGVSAAGGAFWDGGVSADSEAVGMSGDGKGQDYEASGTILVEGSDVHLSTQLSSTMASGNDILTNEGTIVATSVAAAPSLAVSVAVSGVAASSASAAAASKAMGMDGGSGNDTISSSDEIVSTSVASANAISVSVTTGGLTVAMDNFDGGTIAESEAIGISGDGEGRDWFASGSVDVTDEGVLIEGWASTAVVSGDDTINNEGTIVATSVAEALSAAVAVSVEGVGVTSAASTANSRAAAIDAGGGHDNVTSTDELVSTSVANANAVSVSVAPAGVAASFDGGTSASSEAVGISGDGQGRDWSSAGSIEIIRENEELGITPSVAISSEMSSFMVSGDDFIGNDGDITATSVAATPSVGVSVAVYGVAGAVSSSVGESLAMCIDGGAGSDTIENNGDLVSTSVANADSVGVTVVVGGVGLASGGFWDSGTTAESEAIGISGDGRDQDQDVASLLEITDEGIHAETGFSSSMAGGNDDITNYGDIVSTSVAFAPTVDVGVTIFGVAGAITKATAESRAAGIDGGTGDDEINNYGELVETSVAAAVTVPVAVTVGGVNLAGNAFWDGGATAISEAVGVSGDGQGSDWLVGGQVDIIEESTTMSTELSSTMVSGEDTIDNTGPVTVTSVAEAPAVAVAVAVIGASAAIGSAEADSRAVAIDGGAGRDIIDNRVTGEADSGTLVATSVANTINVNVGVTPGGLTLAGNGAFDGGTTATSEAIGISGDGEGSNWEVTGSVEVLNAHDDEVPTEVYVDGGFSSTLVSGDDTIYNEGEIVTTSVSVAPSVAVGVAVWGAAGAVSSATAESRAAAIDGGGGGDTITNKVISGIPDSGLLVATSVANANSVNVGVGVFGISLSSNGAWDGGTTAVSEAIGISGDGEGLNYLMDNYVHVIGDDVMLGTSLTTESVHGTDIINNEGEIVATSVAVAPNVDVSVTVIGAAAAISDTTAEARAAAIDAGAGGDTVTNSGELTATSVANADTIEVSVGLLGGAVADAGAKAMSEAVGISGDGRGGDEYIEGTIEANDDYFKLGASYSRTAATGNDTITNDGKITATSVVVAPSAAVSVNLLGVAGAMTDAEAVSNAIGIDGGAGDDTVTNREELEVTSTSVAVGLAVSVSGTASGAGNSFWDGGVTAVSNAIGINGDSIDRNETMSGIIQYNDDDGSVEMDAFWTSLGASGDDIIINEDNISATAVAVAPAITAAIGAGVSSAVSTATAEATAVAIDGGGGSDSITNDSELAAKAVANADSVNIATSMYGVSAAANSFWDGGTESTAKAVGISGDSVHPDEIYEGHIDVTNNLTFLEGSYSSTAANGNDTITNQESGKITATSVSVAPSVSLAISIGGVSAAVSTATSESVAVAIEAGGGDDTVTNWADLEADAVANADSINLSMAGIGVTGATDSVWDGGTTAKAEAVGISGDRVGKDELTEYSVEVDGDGVLLSELSSGGASSGNDEITNHGDISATSVVVAPSVSVSFGIAGVSAALSAATAESRAVAIDAGDGDDATVTNTGKLTAISVSNADAVSVAAEMVGISGAGNAAWDGGTTARAEAVGINGDSYDTESTLRTIEITADGVTLMEEKIQEATGGDDIISNSNEIEAKAKAVTVSADVALTGVGIAAAVSTATAESRAAAIDAGGGSDTVINTADLIADSDAVGVAVAVGIAPVGIGGATDAVWDGGTTAEANAVGIGGDGSGEKVTTTKTIQVDGDGVDIDVETIHENLGGDDNITNEGVIVASADANTTSVGVSAVVIGMASASSIGTARANAAAIDASGGNDTVVNKESIAAYATAEANTIETTVGLASLNIDPDFVDGIDEIDEIDEIDDIAELAETEWDSGTTAEAKAGGILGGVGNDNIMNQAYVGATSTANTTSTGVSATLFGAAGAIVSANADAYSTAIDSGAGDDVIKNSGPLVSVANANAIGTSVAVGLIGFAGTETSTKATAESYGIETGDGDDGVCNAGAIWSIADAEAKAVDVSVTVAGAGMSSAPYSGETLAQSHAYGIVSTDGMDTLTNDAFILLGSDAEIATTSVGISIAGYSAAVVSSTAIADATGMAGGDDDDKLANRGWILASVNADAPAASVSVGLAGAAHADASSNAEAYATGMAGGSGNDEIVNAGIIDLFYTADASSSAVIVELVGETNGDVDALAYSSGVGLDGGSGNDEIHNIGSTRVISTAKAPVAGTSVNLAGAGFQQIGSTANAVAKGAILGGGQDFIGNTGSLKAEAKAENEINGISFSIAGASSGEFKAEADTEAIGVEAGNGEDLVFNDGTIDVDAKTDIEASGEVDVVFGYSGANATVEGSSSANGITGGDNNDQVFNAGTVDVYAEVDAESSNSSWNLAGSSGAEVGITTEVYAAGFDGGSGNDLLSNTGTLMVNAESTSTIDKSSWTLAGASSDTGGLVSTGEVFGIKGGTGGDDIYNVGTLDVDVSVTLDATGEKIDDDEDADSVAIFGSANSEAELSASADAVGIDGGNDNDLIANLGTMNVDAVATLESSTVSFSFIGTSASGASLTADAAATGIIGGYGLDDVFNDGSLTVKSDASMTATGGARTDITVGDGTFSTTTATATSTAKGIITGSSADLVINTGTVSVTAEANPYSSNNTTTGGLFANDRAESFTEASTYATAVDLGSGADELSNRATITVSTGGKAESWANSDGGTWFSVDVDAHATTNATVDETIVYGIRGTSSAKLIANESSGTLSVTAGSEAYSNSNANGESVYDGEGTAEATSQVDASTAYGIVVGGGNNKIGNGGTITVETNAKAASDAISDSDGFELTSQPDSKATATAKVNNALAVGIKAGDGINQVLNTGTLTVIASPLADEAHAKADHGGYEATGIDSFAWSYAYANNAQAYGIQLGDGGSDIWNTGTITVKSLPKAVAFSESKGCGTDGDAESRSTAEAQNAWAIGIQTGTGHDEIWNDGTIYVETNPDVSATSEAHDAKTGEKVEKETVSTSGRQAIGITTGDGNDLVVNNGTITAVQDKLSLFGVTVTIYGVGVDTGNGADIVALTDGSKVNGNIYLGDGDDALNLSGSSVVAALAYSTGAEFPGTVDGGANTDTAILYGGGSFIGSLVNFEGGLKLGPGTYTIPAPPPFDILEVVEGTLVLVGDYTFNDDGTYVPHIDPDGSCPPLEITGTATIAGDVQLIADSGAFIDGTDYEVLLAKALEGDFEKLDMPDSAILTFIPMKDDGSIGVEVDVASFKTMADTLSEGAIAEYLDRLTPTASGDLSNAIGEFQRLSESEFNDAFSSINPEQYAASAKSYMESSQQSFEALQDRLDNLRKSVAFAPLSNSNMSEAANLAGFSSMPVKPHGFWHEGSKLYSYEEEPGVTTLMLNAGDFASIGFDQSIGSNFTIGYGKDYAELINTSGFSNGDGTVSSIKHFVYGSYSLDTFYMDAAFFYGNEEYSHQRSAIGTMGRSFASEHDSESFSSYIETGRLFVSGPTILQPFASLEYMFTREESFVESGGGAMALRVDEMENELLVSNLGIRASRMWTLDSFTIMPEISLAWRYYMEPGDFSTRASFVSAPGEYFTIHGAREGFHALDVGASLNLLNNDNFSMNLDFKGELLTDEDRYDVEWKLEYKF